MYNYAQATVGTIIAFRSPLPIIKTVPKYWAARNDYFDCNELATNEDEVHVVCRSI